METTGVVRHHRKKVPLVIAIAVVVLGFGATGSGRGTCS
jgi:hypothetical protein